jgi:hypothetical protein
MANSSRTAFWAVPKTTAGRWAAGLTAAFVAMFILNAAVLIQFAPTVYEQNLWLRAWFLPAFGITMLLCGLAGGILGGVAILRQREPTLWPWGSLLIGLLVLLLGGSELIQYASSLP